LPLLEFSRVDADHEGGGASDGEGPGDRQRCQRPRADRPARLCVYSASKAALAKLTRQSAVELGERGIRVNAVTRGDRHHRQRPPAPAGGDPRFAGITLRRAGTRDEVAAVVAFLASDDGSYVTGAAWAVHGGALVRPPL
jgi:NAD(P)-dependent dehydrogenase (short-subunit alcohol dehydrogenase family)